MTFSYAIKSFAEDTSRLSASSLIGWQVHRPKKGGSGGGVVSIVVSGIDVAGLVLRILFHCRAVRVILTLKR